MNQEVKMTKLEFRIYRLLKNQTILKTTFDEMVNSEVVFELSVTMTNEEIAKILKTTITSVENVFSRFYERGWFILCKQNKTKRERYLLRNISVDEDTKEVREISSR